MSNYKMSQEQREQIAELYEKGKTQSAIAEEFGIERVTVNRICRKLNAKRQAPRPVTVEHLREFVKRAHSILWAQGSGGKNKAFDDWKARVKELSSPDGGGFTKNEAIVRASKEYTCLNQLFREYDVRKYDRNPESHPQIRHFGEPDNHAVECEGLEQTYRDSLRWAAKAAGRTQRTGEKPTTCPCDDAWYYYEQAVNDPKDFLSRVGQVESKGDAESAEKKSAREAGKRSMAEIDSMLAELESEGESDES